MKVLLIRGLAASGKSTFSQALIDANIGDQFWNKDIVFDRLLTSGIDWNQANKITYDNLYASLLENDAQQLFVIDAPFYRSKDLAKLVDFCKNHSILFQSILVTCSNEEEWRRRFEQRKINPKPNQKITNFDEIKSYYGSMEVNPVEGELIYDSCNPIELEEIMKYLGIECSKL